MSSFALNHKRVMSVYVLNPYVLLDPDAAKFITAASLTDATQINAVNFIVKSLKEADLWTKLYAYYPFIGGNANSHRLNLVNPSDLDSAFRLIFTNVTHSSSGITGNGTSAYCNTKFNESLHLTDNTACYFFRNKSAVTSSNQNHIAFGVYNGASVGSHIILYSSAQYVTRLMNYNSSGDLGALPTNTIGNIIINRNSSDAYYVSFGNGINRLISNSTSAFSTKTNLPMYVLARNTNGAASGYYSGTCSCFGMSKGLSLGDSNILSNIMTKADSILGR